LNRGWLLILLLVSVHLSAQEAGQPAVLHRAGLVWVDCWFEPFWDRELHCGHFYPSRSTDKPEVRLPVVVIPARQAERHSSPILYLPGGPGMPVGLDARGLQRWLNWADNARWPHDLVLFDPRGTGLSQPKLDCPEIRLQDGRNLTRPLTAADDLRALQQSAAACYRRLQRTGFDPEAYSTARQVQDVVELMEMVGGHDWNLYGISYGSRLALQVLRQNSGRVRSLVLDSVYPPGVNGLLSRPAQFARAWEGLLLHCAADAECRLQYPQLGRDLDNLFFQLGRDPVLLKIEQWPSDQMTSLLLNDYRLLWMLFLESYQPRYRPRLIPAVMAATKGNFLPWQPIAADYLKEWLDPDFSHAVYLSTTCAEDLPGTTDDLYQKEVRRYPKVAAYTSEEWRLSPCRRWPVKPLTKIMRQPVRTTLPVLLLNGRHDAATLPEWAKAQFADVANGHHLVFEGSSHGVTWENPCAMAVAWEFLRDPQGWPLPPCLSEWERREMGSHRRQ
jgi:pimeloyl-ACP methyl ester carboxylesterase